MKDAYYFPHDSNAIQDPKMMTLLSECGLMGIGMYWILVEILHQQKDGRITEDAYKKYINFYYHFDNTGTHGIDKIQQVLNTCGLLLNKNGFVYSHRVLKNHEHRKEISEKRSFAGKKSAETRIKSTGVQQVFNKGQQGKERKGKEIKENKSTPVFPFLENKTFGAAFNDYLEMRKRARRPATDRARELVLIKLHKYTVETAIKMLEKSTTSSWTDVYPLKENEQQEVSGFRKP